MKPANERFQVKEDVRSHGDPFELEVSTRYSVVDTETDEVLFEFHSEIDAGNFREGWEDRTASGVKSVEIDTKALEVVVAYFDGPTERRPLPG